MRSTSPLTHSPRSSAATFAAICCPTDSSICVMPEACGVRRTPRCCQNTCSGGGGLDVDDVERGAGEPARVERGEQRRFIDEAAARDVDEPRAGRQPRQPLGVEQARGVLRQRGDQHEQARAREEGGRLFLTARRTRRVARLR